MVGYFKLTQHVIYLLIVEKCLVQIAAISKDNFLNIFFAVFESGDKSEVMCIKQTE